MAWGKTRTHFNDQATWPCLNTKNVWGAPDLILTSDDIFSKSDTILLEKFFGYLSSEEQRNLEHQRKTTWEKVLKWVRRIITLCMRELERNIKSKDRVRMRDGESREGNKGTSWKHHERIKKESIRIGLSVHFLSPQIKKFVCATLWTFPSGLSPAWKLVL